MHETLSWMLNLHCAEHAYYVRQSRDMGCIFHEHHHLDQQFSQKKEAVQCVAGVAVNEIYQPEQCHFK